MEKYINPFTEFGFKYFFTDNKKKKYILKFLNDILMLVDEITDFDYYKNDTLQLMLNPKNAILLKCQDAKGNNFFINLTLSNKGNKKADIVRNLIFGQASSIMENYNNFSSIYSIIMNYNNELSTSAYFDYLQFKNQDNKPFFEKFSTILIDFDKFIKKENELLNQQDKWLLFFISLSKYNKISDVFQNTLFKEIFPTMLIENLSENEKYLYEKSLTALNNFDSFLYSSIEQEKEKSFKEGQKQKTIELALQLLDVLDDKTISEKTGLSLQAIKSLRNKKNMT